MNAQGKDFFDQWLGQQLNEHAAAHPGPTPKPMQARYHAAHVAAALHVPFLTKVAALIGTKMAIGATVGILAVGAASGEAIITNSINPSDWGKQVVEQVNKCKEALAPGSHGIGPCVSAFASQHGKGVSSDHKVKATPSPGRGPDHTPGPPPKKDHPTPPVNAHPSPPVKAHPSPPAKAHPSPPVKKKVK